MPVIPLPAVSELDGSTPLPIGDYRIVTEEPRLEPVAAWLATEIGGEGAVPVQLAIDDAGLDALPATGGVRADGGDPDGERYGLAIDSDGVRIWGTSAEGVFRGATTLRQLIGTDQPLPAGRILNTPRFAWRGFSLDVCRRFFPVDEVRQIIDLLALYKVNVLHLHLTNSEGWRLEIAGWPKLAAIGGNSARGGRPGGSISNLVLRVSQGTEVLTLLDRDGRTEEEIQAVEEVGATRVLRRREIESYLLDEEVLAAFCDSVGKAECIAEVIEMSRRAMLKVQGRGGRDIDEMKDAAG